MWVTIVGTGMEGAKTLTAEALEAITGAELLIGAERVLEPFSGRDCERFVSWSPEQITQKLAESDCGTAAVLMSGDVGFFSGAKKLLPMIKALPNVSGCRLVCGISSPMYLAAAAGVPWERMKFVSLHGLDGSIAVNVKLNEFTFFLLGGRVTPAMLCERLCEYGLGDTIVTVGSRLGYPDEYILTAEASELYGSSFDRLCSVIVRNPGCLRYVPSAIPDSEFVRAEIPMTKAEVRSLAVASLNICSDSVCWDIGSGSGSVSVEMALRCPDGEVCAVEHKPEAADLTAENSRRFSCDNISIIRGRAPEALTGLPAPDRVFVGGSSGSLGEILAAARSKNPGALVTVTAVSLETLAEAADLIDGEVTQVAVTRTRKLGSHTMLSALNPVFIISGRFR